VSDLEATQKHLDEITLLLYAERQLDRASAQEVSLHTQTCVKCMTLLRALDRESRLLTRAMLEPDEALPARLTEFQAHVKRNMQWIWGLVFGLAVLGVYTLYSSFVQPWELQAEQAGFGSTNLVNLLIFQGAFWKGWQSMFTLFEVFALMAMGGVGMFAIRKYLRRGSALAMMVATFGLLAAVGAPPAGATDFRKGDAVEIGKDETVKGDLYFSGRQLRIEGTVDGDVYIFGQQAIVSGHVTGDVICFAQSLRVSGQVDGSVRSATNNVTVSGNVSHGVMAFNEVFNLDPNGKVGRSLTLFSQTATIDGKVGRDLLAFFGQATVSGGIGGDLRARGDSLSISSGAEIDGKSLFEGEKPAEVSSGAKLGSTIEFKKIEHHEHSKTRDAGYYIWHVIWTGAFLLFGLVLFSIMPQFSRESVQSGEHYGASFGFGVLVLSGVPIAAFIMCITIIGMFLGLSTIFLWFVVLLASDIVVGTIVGQWMMGRSTEFWPFVLRMIAGVVLVRVVTSIPFIGGWAGFVVAMWGMGAIAQALYRRLQPVVAPNNPSMPMVPGMTPQPSNTTVGGM